MTSPTAHPNPSWLNFVVTGKARSNIRHFLKGQQQAESVVLGRRLLEQALADVDANYEEIPPETLKALLSDLKFKDEEELLFAIGIGNQMALVIAKRLVVEKGEGENVSEEPDSGQVLAIKGTEGMVVRFADCCQPIPGDAIVGCFQQGRGILVHVNECPQVALRNSRNQQYIALRWDEQVEGEYWVDITVEVDNQRGVLAALASAIAESHSNIGNIHVDPKDGKHNAVLFSIGVRDRSHLARVMRRLRSNTHVTRLYRKKLEA